MSGSRRRSCIIVMVQSASITAPSQPHHRWGGSTQKSCGYSRLCSAHVQCTESLATKVHHHAVRGTDPHHQCWWCIMHGLLLLTAYQ
jgi:hypothetical protein